MSSARALSGTSAATGSPDRKMSTKLSKLTASSTSTEDRKSTRLNSSHSQISYAGFCLKKKNEVTIGLVDDVTWVLSVVPCRAWPGYGASVRCIVRRGDVCSMVSVLVGGASSYTTSAHN